MFIYFANGSPQTNNETGVVFNIVREVMGLLSQHQFIPVNDVSESEKADARCLIKLAFDNFTDVVICNDTSNSSYSNALATPLPQFQHQYTIHPRQHFLQQFGLSTESENAYTIQASVPPIGRTSDPQMLDECVGSETLFFSEEDNLQQYLDSELLSLSLGIVDSQADLGTAVTAFFLQCLLDQQCRIKRYGLGDVSICVEMEVFDKEDCGDKEEGTCAIRLQSYRDE